MAKPDHILLENATGSLRIPILFENRSVMAIDKPAHWLIVPPTWSQTSRNLQAAILDSLQARDFWAASRNLRYLRFIHRLDAETTGILLFAKSQGAMPVYSRLFESRRVTKIYLAVCSGIPSSPEWTCQSPLEPDPHQKGRVQISKQNGKPAETIFKVIHQTTRKGHPLSLIAARPVTGRTHQIRVHLAAANCPIVGDLLYQNNPSPTSPTSPPPSPRNSPNLGLRAVRMSFIDPFQKRPVQICAPWDQFLKLFHLDKVPSLLIKKELKRLS